MQQVSRWMFVALIGAMLFAVEAGAQDADVRKHFVNANKNLTSARRYAIAKKYDEAAKFLVDAEKSIEALKKANLPANQKRTVARFETAATAMRKQLKAAGAKFPGGGDTPAPATPGTPNIPDSNISFLKNVAPLLATKCGRCHMGNQRKGNFSMQTFASLMQGIDGAAVVSANNGKASHIVEVIADGDMPRGGGKVSPQELAMLTKWIDEGAKYDGNNPNMALNNLAAPAANTPRPKLEVTQATGNEKIKYSRDIAPVLAAQCMGCHGADDASADFSVASFRNLLRGGDSGVAIMPGKPADSLLIGKLKGTAGGDRMPRRRPPLPNDVIAKFETWIAEGAKFDGSDPLMSTRMVANIYKAQTMSHAELAAERMKYAAKNWRLANPEESYETAETEHFQVVGNVIKSRLEEIGKMAEQEHDRVAKLFDVPSGEPLLKGKLTIFVFNRRFEYSEYGTMVEKRRIPRSWRGHWFYNIIDAYACVSPPTEGQDTMERLLSELVTGAYLESLGDVPRWFSQGIARAVSAKSDPKNPAVESWNESLPEVLGRANPATLVEGKMPLEDAGVVAYGFGQGILSKKGQYTKLVNALKQGSSFNAAFQQAFRTDPKTLVMAWARSGGR